MRKYSQCIIFTCFFGCIYGQERVINVDEYLYNEVYKNIAAYNIRYASHSFNGVIFKNTFRDNADFFYGFFLPNYGYKLELNIVNLDSSYLSTAFRLYKIHLVNGFSFALDTKQPGYASHGLVTDNDSLGPVTGYGSLGPITSDDFLVALNEATGSLKFISGQFFHSMISEDFTIDRKNPETLIQYLRFRSFVVGGQDIKFKKRKHSKLIYEGFSNLYHCPFLIEVDKKNLDYTTIKIIKNRHL